MGPEDLKLIDFYKKSETTFVLFFGDKNDDSYWGDDWNDAPYEHNAGEVYDRYVKTKNHVHMSNGFYVYEPCDGGNSWSKEDFKKRLAPCLVISKTRNATYDYLLNYDSLLDKESSIKLYFNDSFEDVEKKLNVALAIRVKPIKKPKKKYNQKHKFLFFNSRKECLRYNDNPFAPWRMTSRPKRLHCHDGYFLLTADYFQKLEMELENQFGLRVKSYYLDEDYNICFHADIPVMKEYANDEYLSSIKTFKFNHNDKEHIFVLSQYIVRREKNKRLRLLYYPEKFGADIEKHIMELMQ